MPGATMPDIGDYNERVVLHAIRSRADGISQAELARQCGLSRQTVSLVVRRLSARGLIRDCGTRAGARGKPATILRVEPRAVLAGGIHLDPTGTTIAVVDLAGHAIAHRTLGPVGADPVADIAEIVEALSGLHPAGTSRLLGLGIASPGGIDATAGVITTPPALPGWRDVPVVELFQKATGLAAILGKDTAAVLVGELWTAPPSSAHTVVQLYVGMGVGSAVSTGGHIHYGATTQAGEIGHLPTGFAGPLCDCGRRGCLWQFTDVPRVLERARQLGIGAVAAQAQNPQLAAIAAIVSAARAGHDSATELIGDYGRALASALATLIDIHDPSRVLIGGPLWPLLGDLVLPIIRGSLTGRHEHLPLDSARSGALAGAVGAAALVLHGEFAPRRLVGRA